MKLADLLVAALAILAVFANAALAADIKYKASVVGMDASQRPAVIEALNPGLTATA